MLNRILTLVLIGFFILGGYVAYVSVTLPNVKRAIETGVEPAQTSQVLARDRSVILSYGKFQHKPVDMADIPQPLIDALIATEDRRFYHHQGVDVIGILRALVQNVRSRGVHEGGSTLTQQLARNIFLSHERSIQRKIKEALLALKIEQTLTKDQILELYLNNVYFGEGAYGVGAASNIYFGKPAGRLTLPECALLAGLPQAPSLYSPFANPELAVKRRNEVIDNLAENGKLDAAEVARYKAAGLRLNPSGRNLASSDKAPFFNRHVINTVRDMLDMDEQTFWQQGLKVHTTLDPRAQAIAASQVSRLSRAYGRGGAEEQAALFSVDDRGRMLAYVGGKDFSVSQFDRVAQAKRQAGSLFKVFVYTGAMERGFTPLTVYRDSPVSFGDWRPENYDHRYHGYMTLARALAQSNNIIAVKLLNDLSPETATQLAQRMGIRSPVTPNLSLALGSADVSLYEMTSAFSVLANNGNYVEPYAIEKITDRDGRILYQHSPSRQVVLQRMPRDTMVAMMKGVLQHGTARGAAIGRPAAGKTGTSDDYRDAWFIGFTPGVTTGVWVGNDNNSKMPGITGGSLPARIWQAYMGALLAGTPVKDFDLTYAQPLEEKDFFVYNLDNLAASEQEAAGRHGGYSSGDISSEEAPPVETDTPAEAEADPNTLPELVPTFPDMNQGASPTVPPVPPVENRPGASPALPKGGNAGDRFFDFDSPGRRPRGEGEDRSEKPGRRSRRPADSGQDAPVPQPVADPLREF